MKISIKNKTKINTSIFGKEPETEEEFYALGNSLVVWAEKDNSLNIDEFSLGMRILPDSLKEFAKKSDYFTRTLKLAIYIIGARRERLAMQGTINQRIVLATLPLYDSEYRKWLLNLKHNPESESEPTTWNIYMKDYSTGESRLVNSYTVPPKSY